MDAKCTIPRQKNTNLFWGGGIAPPKIHTHWGEGRHSSPNPTRSAPRYSILRHSTCPPKRKSLIRQWETWDIHTPQKQRKRKCFFLTRDSSSLETHVTRDQRPINPPSTQLCTRSLCLHTYTGRARNMFRGANGGGGTDAWKEKYGWIQVANFSPPPVSSTTEQYI